MINLKNQGEKEAFVTGLLMNGGAISGDSGGTGPQFVNLYNCKEPLVVIDKPDNVSVFIYHIPNTYKYYIDISRGYELGYITDITIDGVSLKTSGILCDNFIVDTNTPQRKIINISTANYKQTPVVEMMNPDGTPAYTGPLLETLSYSPLARIQSPCYRDISLNVIYGPTENSFKLTGTLPAQGENAYIELQNLLDRIITVNVKYSVTQLNRRYSSEISRLSNFIGPWGNFQLPGHTYTQDYNISLDPHQSKDIFYITGHTNS